MAQSTGGIVKSDLLPYIGETVNCCGIHMPFYEVCIRTDEVITITISEQRASYKTHAAVDRLVAKRQESMQ